MGPAPRRGDVGRTARVVLGAGEELEGVVLVAEDGEGVGGPDGGEGDDLGVERRRDAHEVRRVGPEERVRLLLAVVRPGKKTRTGLVCIERVFALFFLLSRERARGRSSARVSPRERASRRVEGRHGSIEPPGARGFKIIINNPPETLKKFFLKRWWCVVLVARTYAGVRARARRRGRGVRPRCAA